MKTDDDPKWEIYYQNTRTSVIAKAPYWVSKIPGPDSLKDDQLKCIKVMEISDYFLIAPLDEQSDVGTDSYKNHLMGTARFIGICMVIVLGAYCINAYV